MRSVFESVPAADFDRRVLASERPVLVFFWGLHSAPCRLFAPALEALARERTLPSDRVKVSVDGQQALVRRLRLGALPAVLVFEAGEVVAAQLGTGTRAELAALFERAERQA